ncbi:hypothetical protein ISS40_07895 [Candidatus Bathyarchaeota archaeon]|nr:hypothetical protein [Candidatus Bathyarchaeota archaeon]
MREYILTASEREIIEVFKAQGFKLEGFHTLRTRGRQAIKRLEEDLVLLRDLLEAE